MSEEAMPEPLSEVGHSGDQGTDKLQVGLSFRDLDCHGFLTSAAYQSTFVSVLAKPFRLLKRGSRQRVQILHRFEGLILPGEMLLVLGRPGSGCSTLLKTLSGETHGFHVGQETHINYQGANDELNNPFIPSTPGIFSEPKLTSESFSAGISYNQMHRDFTGERIFLAELDVHFPELTVAETLDFAASCRPNTATINKSTNTTPGRAVASLFNLDNALDTKIGDAMIRGVSGGEKRRTSIAETLMSGAQLQCWDNSTRGLDSSTAKQFIRLLRTTSTSRKSTVAMSLYQASESMYQCFDRVVLLYEGREIFFGPVQAASDYFTNLGFSKPSRATTPDFLTSITNTAEQVAREGFEDRLPRSPEQLAAAWEKSELRASLLGEIQTFDLRYPIRNDKSGSSSEKHEAGHKLNIQAATFPLTSYRQVHVCLCRAAQRLANNYPPAVSTVVANSILGLIVGSAFYKLGEDSDSLRNRSILLFFALMLNAFIPAFEVDLMWAQRPIVEKQSRYAFYHPFTEALASILCSLPIKVLLAIFLHVPIYFLTNLRLTAQAVFVYWFFMLANLVTMSMFFRMIGSLSRSRSETMTVVSILTVLCVLYTGFVVPPPYMVPWLAWFRWVNPVAYTYESLMINELSERQFPCSSTVPDGPRYSSIPIDLKLCSEIGRDPGSNYVQGTNYLSLKYNYTQDHLWRNLGILMAMMIFFGIVHLLATEYISAERSRGEVLLFKRYTDSTLFRQKEKDNEASAQTAFIQEVPSRAQTDKTTHERNIAEGLFPNDHRRKSVFHWTNVVYDVKTKKGTRRILDGIDGWLKPGTFTVLMGATGAGKTSLLDVLAQRTSSGKTEGERFIDTKSCHTMTDFQRRIGYVQQNDIHLPTSTVREALQFSALLRQASTQPREEKMRYVETVLDLLEMKAYADAIVGIPGEGLNVEQRKRLSIAVEMVAKPDMALFLDEPTSGLDSQTAWSICTLLRKLVDNNETLICTVHQPSSQLFCMFDQLLLLKNGSTVYFGDIGSDASILTTYFESLGASKCLPEDNPAEWMLDVIGTHGPRSSGESWAEQWNRSAQRQAISQQLEDLSTKESSQRIDAVATQGVNKEYATPLLYQMLCLMRRTFQDQWRDPVYLYTKISVIVGLGLVNGISFYKADHDIQGLTNLLFSIFLIAQLFSPLSMLVLPRFTEGRNLFEARERNSKMYSWVAFVSSNILVEVTWLTLIAVPLFSCWFYPTGIYQNVSSDFGTAERSGAAFILIWLFCLWASTLSQVFAAGMELQETALQVVTLFFWLSLVFCGILVPPGSFPRFWIFMYRVSPLTYVLEGLAIIGVSNQRIECSSIEMLHITLPPDAGTCGDYLLPYSQMAGGTTTNIDETSGECLYCPVANANIVLDALKMGSTKGQAWRDVGIVASFVVFNILTVFGVYWLSRVPKKNKRNSKS